MMKLNLLLILVKTGSIRKRLNISLKSLQMVWHLKKVTDFKVMLKHSTKMFNKFTTGLTSTIISLSQNFTRLNLSKKLISLKKLNKPGTMPPQLMRLTYSDTVLSLGLDLMSLESLNKKLIPLEEFLKNTSKFPTLQHHGKTKSREGLNLTWLILLLPQ